MNRDELLKFHDDFTAKMEGICRRKNADYAGDANDPFANFRRVESMGIASTVQGFLTRMTDKLSRLSSFAQAGSLQVKDESVFDTCIDLANYSVLLAAYLSDMPRSENAFSTTPEQRGATAREWYGVVHTDGSMSAYVKQTDAAERLSKQFASDFRNLIRVREVLT